jgi:hypothetical protein
MDATVRDRIVYQDSAQTMWFGQVLFNGRRRIRYDESQF